MSASAQCLKCCAYPLLHMPAPAPCLTRLLPPVALRACSRRGSAAPLTGPGSPSQQQQGPGLLAHARPRLERRQRCRRRRCRFAERGSAAGAAAEWYVAGVAACDAGRRRQQPGPQPEGAGAGVGGPGECLQLTQLQSTVGHKRNMAGTGHDRERPRAGLNRKRPRLENTGRKAASQSTVPYQGTHAQGRSCVA